MPLWYARAVLRVVIRQPQWRHMEPLLEQNLAEHEVVAHLDESTVDRFQTVSALVLLLGGGKSPAFVTTQPFEAMQSVIPNATLEILHGLDHLAPSGTAPEQVGSRVRAFVDAVPMSPNCGRMTLNMRVIGQPRNSDNGHSVVWLRRFFDMASRANGPKTCYTGPVWSEHRHSVNASLLRHERDSQDHRQHAWHRRSMRGRCDARGEAAARRRRATVTSIIIGDQALTWTDINANHADSLGGARHF
jgi:hypothetical protein